MDGRMIENSSLAHSPTLPRTSLFGRIQIQPMLPAMGRQHYTTDTQEGNLVSSLGDLVS
jgi:hypothetical protein